MFVLDFHESCNYGVVYIGDTMSSYYSRSVMKEIEAGLGDVFDWKSPIFYDF